MKKRTYVCCFVIIIFSFCCDHKSGNEKVQIDLSDKSESIPYSTFVESIDYIDLNTNDSCLISEIKRIYLDDDTLLVLDKKGAGVFTFTKDGKLTGKIDYYGKGPEEFSDITAFTIDPLHNSICILDYESQKINRYSYKGEFQQSIPTTTFARDFVVLENDLNMFILPYYSKHSPCGIWTASTNDILVKIITKDIPEYDQFEFVGTYYNLTQQSIYYYDRNWDRLSYVTKDTIKTLYEFDLKQRLQDDLREKDPWTVPLDGFAMMNNFSLSSNYLLLSYYLYRNGEPYIEWVLLNRETNTIMVADDLINDIDKVSPTTTDVFYLKDNLWCREVDSNSNDCNIHMQILSVR